MITTDADIDAYLASLPDEVRDDMILLDNMITKIFDGKVRELWVGKFWGGSEQKIIGYGDMTFVGSNKKPVQWFMVGLALQKNYISIYNCATEDGIYTVKKHADKLGKVKTGASSISFKSIADVNMDELRSITEFANSQVPAN